MITSKDYTVKTRNGVVEYILRSDGACIPADPRNRDYQEFVVVDAAGKCSWEEVVVPLAEPSEDELVRSYVLAEMRGDTVAKAAAKSNIVRLDQARVVKTPAK